MKYLARACLSIALAGCGSSAASEFGTTGAGGAVGAGGAGTTSGAGGGPSSVPLRAKAVAVGAAHSCALLTDQTVACWGDGSLGQLGDGLSGPGYHRAFAARVPGIAGATAIRAGDDTTCALLADHMACWGDGADGQLGDGTASAGYFQSSPGAVQGIGRAADLSVRGSAACAALPDGGVSCWGSNGPLGWLGFFSPACGPYPMDVNGDTSLVSEPCEKIPRAVPGVAAARAVVTSGAHTCAIVQGARVSCWGADSFGQLGDGVSGPTAVDPEPALVPAAAGATHLALGTSHTCAVVGEQGAVLCWGDDSLGQLGDGGSGIDAYQTKPTGVPGLAGVSDLDAAGDVTCAVLADHLVRCWGDASPLLSPSNTAAPTVVKPTIVPGVSAVVAVRTSGQHACALRDDATVVCWGQNDSGQLGDGTLSLAEGALAPVPSP